MDESRFSVRPEPDECDAYYHRYIGLVPEGDVLLALKNQVSSTLALFQGLPESKHGFRYAPGKWTTWEVLRHMVDTEWVMTFRALHFARAARSAIPGMDQDEFQAGVGPANRSVATALDEFWHLRTATQALFASFDGGTLARKGIASERSFTVRALIYIIAGHERHHVNVLKDRYL